MTEQPHRLSSTGNRMVLMCAWEAATPGDAALSRLNKNNSLLIAFCCISLFLFYERDHSLGTHSADQTNESVIFS